MFTTHNCVVPARSIVTVDCDSKSPPIRGFAKRPRGATRSSLITLSVDPISTCRHVVSFHGRVHDTWLLLTVMVVLDVVPCHPQYIPIVVRLPMLSCIQKPKLLVTFLFFSSLPSPVLFFPCDSFTSIPFSWWMGLPYTTSTKKSNTSVFWIASRISSFCKVRRLCSCE